MAEPFRVLLSYVKNKGFVKKMEIVKFMIEAGRPVLPSEIQKATSVKHYPTINYHLKQLVKEGVVIPLEDGRYMVQPVMVDGEIDGSLEEAVNRAIQLHYTDHIDAGNGKAEVTVKTFINSFLYYVTYLLYTGNFKTKTSG